jgi:hypothetical protein
MAQGAGQVFNFSILGIFAIVIYLLSNSFTGLEATPSLKFKHRDAKIEHKCKFCHHRNPKRCSICHASGVAKENKYDELPHKIQRLHKLCRDCHIKEQGLLEKARENLAKYVNKESKCLLCHK